MAGSIESKRKWAAKNKHYFENYRRDNADKIKNRNKTYYDKNKQHISDKRKTNYKGEVKAKYQKYSKVRYQENKQQILAKNNARRIKMRDQIYSIALHYGCQNNKCQWVGDFLPSQLHFHHLDPSEKEYNVSMLAGWSKTKLVNEINKCCVLCACCHTAITVGSTDHKGNRCNVDLDLKPII